MKYVAYYRTSTKSQNLGIAAQQSAVNRFLRTSDELVAEFAEQESGKDNSRAELSKALQLCASTGSVLLIAKLDRLSRNVTFISQLMDSKQPFKCCDMPDATNLTIHIFAALAQQEREMISARTKAVLQELKQQGVKLGKPENLTDYSRQKASEALSRKARESKNNIQLLDKVKGYLKDGLSFQAIANELNRLHYKTSRGKDFRAGTVNMLVQRLREQA